MVVTRFEIDCSQIRSIQQMNGNVHLLKKMYWSEYQNESKALGEQK